MLLWFTMKLVVVTSLFLPQMSCRPLNLSHMRRLAATAKIFRVSWLHYWPLVMALYFHNMILKFIAFAGTRHLYRNSWFFDPFHTDPHKHQTLWRQPVTEKSRCSSIKQRWGTMSSSKRERRGKRWGYENDWWEHKWQSCDQEKKGGGGVKGDEGQCWQLSGPTCPPTSRFLSWFASPRRDTYQGQPGKQEQVS